MKKIFLISALLLMLISISAVSADGNFTDLNNDISNGGNIIEINQDYKFDESSDANLKNGISIARSNITINGNEHIIDGNNQAKIFNITGENITISNFKFINSLQAIRYAGNGWESVFNLNDMVFENNTFTDTPITVMGSAFNLKNCTFINSTSKDGNIIHVAETNLNMENTVLDSFQETLPY